MFAQSNGVPDVFSFTSSKEFGSRGPASWRAIFEIDHGLAKGSAFDDDRDAGTNRGILETGNDSLRYR
ncbi:MAG TPA: hypothetical protein VJ840_06485 [Gemmatimonadaceae bacterium]|nr:hypothetical protein [Gemmatimonadaceae bacterium]